jgi:ribosomal protein S18 acetylase RimI-like enzyme
MTTVVVRRAGVEDARSLAELNVHVHALHVEARPRVFKPLDIDTAERWFADLLAKPGTHAWVAHDGGVALGYVLAFPREAAESIFCYARRWYELDQIAVAPGARQQGIARRLVAAVRDAARDDGVTDIQLSTWSFNQRAQAAFEHLGFSLKTLRFWLDPDGG